VVTSWKQRARRNSAHPAMRSVHLLTITVTPQTAASDKEGGGKLERNVSVNPVAGAGSVES